MSCKTCENSTAGFCPDCFETVRTNNQSIEKYIEEFKAKYVVECDEIGLLKWTSCPEQVIDFLRTSLEEYGREVRETPELPMGASNWLEHGIKYGYLEHFNLK